MQKTNKNRQKKTDYFVKLTMVQIFVCAVIFLLVFAAYKLNTKAYRDIAEEYRSNMPIEEKDYGKAFKDVLINVFSPSEKDSLEYSEEESLTQESESETIDVSQETEVFITEQESNDSINEVVGGGEDIAKVDDEIISIVFKPYHLGFSMTSPVLGKITSDYGFREHPISKEWGFHTGIDISAPQGEKILSAYDGRVKEVNASKGRGNYIVIDHGGGMETLYAHCLEILKTADQKVKSGEVIALVGNTGISTASHLHFEIRLNGIVRNPRYALAGTAYEA